MTRRRQRSPQGVKGAPAKKYQPNTDPKRKSNSSPKVTSSSKVTSKPKMTAKAMRTLYQRMAAADVDHWLLGEGDTQHHNWFRALDFDMEGPHPVHDAAMQRIDASLALKKQWEQAIELEQEFQQTLPDPLGTLWLELEKLLTGRTVTNCIAHYNVGVDAGRSMTLVEEALSRNNINTRSIKPDALLTLTTVLADIAKRLETRHP